MFFLSIWVSRGPCWRSFWCLGAPRSTKRSRHGSQDASRSDLENFGTFPRRKASPLLEHAFLFFLCFLCYFFAVLKKFAKKTPKRVCPEGLRRVPVSTGAHFSLLQPNPNRTPKWEPKGSVLGAKVSTKLLFRGFFQGAFLGHFWKGPKEHWQSSSGGFRVPGVGGRGELL